MDKKAEQKEMRRVQRDAYFSKPLTDTQKQIQDIIMNKTGMTHGRKIFYFIDEVGRSGKSWMMNVLSKKPHTWCTQIIQPFSKMAESFAQHCNMIEDGPDRIIIDIERTFVHWKSLHGVLENMKNPYQRNWKNKTCGVDIVPPVIFIFCNTYPSKDLTSDRQVFYVFDGHQYDLVYGDPSADSMPVG